MPMVNHTQICRAKRGTWMQHDQCSARTSLGLNLTAFSCTISAPPCLNSKPTLRLMQEAMNQMSHVLYMGNHAAGYGPCHHTQLVHMKICSVGVQHAAAGLHVLQPACSTTIRLGSQLQVLQGTGAQRKAPASSTGQEWHSRARCKQGCNGQVTPKSAKPDMLAHPSTPKSCAPATLHPSAPECRVPCLADIIIRPAPRGHKEPQLAHTHHWHSKPFPAVTSVDACSSTCMCRCAQGTSSALLRRAGAEHETVGDKP